MTLVIDTGAWHAGQGLLPPAPMSIDLEWNRLDPSLADTLVDLLNRQLANTTRPSFIGPIEVTSFDFGANAPDIELVDLRDIYRDFLEDDEDEDGSDIGGGGGTSSARAPPFPGDDDGEEEDDDDGFEWVSRKAVRGKGIVGADDGPAYHLLPPHVRYGAAAAAGGMGFGMSHMGMHGVGVRDIWSPAFANLADLRPAYPSPSLYLSALSAVSASATPPAALAASRVPDRLTGGAAEDASSEAVASSTRPPSGSDPSAPPTDALQQPPAPAPAPHPNLQLHMHITWHSNLRLTLTTSLLINYPSPMFMALPIKLSVTGLLFTGEVVVGYEGARRRVHLCIVDELDPYGPLGGAERPKRGTPSSAGTPVEDDAPPPPPTPSTPASAGPRAGKPLPVGQRLLPTIYIESEIGQADKHVLKNVTRVERFIQDVIRKTVEEELVFPNFQTFCLGEQ